MKKEPVVCLHDNFLMSPNVRRVQEDPKGPVIDYILEFSIKCADCLQPFRFRGPFAGIVFNQPVVSDDELTLSVPIEPDKVSRNYILGSKIGEA
jgi:hypothetical protein